MQQVFQRVRSSVIGIENSPVLADITVGYVEQQWWEANQHSFRQHRDQISFSFADTSTIG